MKLMLHFEIFFLKFEPSLENHENTDSIKLRALRALAPMRLIHQ